MSSPHLVTFTPTDRFFFGGASGFSDGFFVQSERFPPPTTVMGALRAALLVGAGLLVQHRRGRFVPPEKKVVARELTGTSRLNHLEEQPDFGIIDRISPVFLTRRNVDGGFADAWFGCPADVVRSEKRDGFRRPNYAEVSAKVENCGRPGDVLFASDRDVKSECGGNLAGGAEFWRAWMSGDAIQTGVVDLDDDDNSPFLGRQQTGIGLERRRVVEGRFYVKRDFSMRKGWAFGVIAWFRKTPALPGTIVLGGDQSVFRLECVPMGDGGRPLGDHPVVQSLLGEADFAGTRIAALSQLLVDANHPLLDESRHSLIPHIEAVRMLRSFRVPKSKEDAPDEPQVRDGRKLLKSDAYRVLPAGSVFRMGASCGPEIVGGSELARRLGFNQVFIGRDAAAA